MDINGEESEEVEEEVVLAASEVAVEEVPPSSQHRSHGGRWQGPYNAPFERSTQAPYRV